MLALRRLRPLLQVVGAIVVAVLVLNLLFAAAAALSPNPAAGANQGAQGPLSNLRVDGARQLVDELSAELSLHSGAGQQPLGVILGLSGARGILPQTLASLDPAKRRYAGLSQGGTGTLTIAAVSELVLNSNLDPQLVVFAISPFNLVKGLPESPADLADPNRGDYWLPQRRGRLRQSADSAISTLRRSLFAALKPSRHDVASTSAVPVAQEPTQRPRGYFVTGTRMLELLEQGGYFKASSYHPDMNGLRMLRDLIERFRAAGAIVVIAFIPEQSELRARIPSSAVPVIEQTLQASFAQRPVPIFDFRASCDDSDFADVIHLQLPARERLTRSFAERLFAYLATVDGAH